MPTKLSADRLQEGLQTKRFGRNIFFSQSIGSTNEWAKKLAKFGASEGTVAIAKIQTAGRGRLCRNWISPEGGLWFSVILRPRISASEAVKLVFVAGLVVAEVLHEQYDLQAETKWPNDVLIKGQKVCGVLAEMSTTGGKADFVILGLGVNANFHVKIAFPKGLWGTATSITDETRKKVDLDYLFRALIEKLEDYYGVFLKDGFGAVLKEWKMYAGFLGRRVDIVDHGERVRGTASDVDEDGLLVLKLEDGSLRHFVIGDVSVLC